MIVDPAVIPGLLLLAAELAALAAVGYVVVRVALRQADARAALAQGLVVGLALWGLITNFALYVLPGLAGAAVGWGATLVLGAVLAWRAGRFVWPRPWVAAGFTAVVLALLWLTLASRQLLESPDPTLHLGLAAWMRAGGFPPELPWNPGYLVRYHHGADLLVGLLTPPIGPDLAFVQELLGAYAWTSFALVVATGLLRRGSWRVALVVAPLLLTAGAWTWTNLGGGILRLPVPTGAPAAGSWEALADVYWPSLGPSWPLESAALHDIWTPAFTLGYALTFVVLEHAARPERATWAGVLTLGAIVGFLGILVTSLAPVVVVLWAALAAVHIVRERPGGDEVLRLGAGLGVAVALMLLGGGALTGLLDGGPANGLGLSWDLNGTRWQALGAFDARSGSIGVLGVGPAVLAGVAVVLARRDRLVVALAAGAALLVMAWLILSYPPAPWVLSRLAGHARNLALVALLLALAARLTSLESTRWRLAAPLLIVSLVGWPTIAGPVRSLATAVGSGVQLANAGWAAKHLEYKRPAASMRRFQMPAMSDRLASYIRDHIPLDARVLTPKWPYWAVSLATGRPGSAGFSNLSHLIFFTGSEYLDAVGYLEPDAIRRLGIEYVHATDDWAAALPRQAQRWLADPGMFELLARDGAEALYRVRQAFLTLDVEPHPETYEALRAAPSSTIVHLAPELGWLDGLRVASVLSHTHLTGAVDTQLLHLQAPTPWTVEPPGEQAPNLAVLPASVEPPRAPNAEWTRIWRNDDIAVYAPASWRSRATNESWTTRTASTGIG
ncbi:MAG: hypothetical protein OXG43_11040 [Chloroflexi bacterium]|nr:hypothetical protein [Chloroflexota bacterium]